MNKRLIFILILLLLPAAAATEQEVRDTLLYYNYYFATEDLDGYLNTIVTSHLPPAELEERTAGIQALWDAFDTVSYADDPPYDITVEDGVGIISYTLFAEITDGVDVIEQEQELVAILFQEPDAWRVFTVLPAAQLDHNIALHQLTMIDESTELFGVEPTQETTDEEQVPTQEIPPALPDSEPTCNPDMSVFAEPVDLSIIPQNDFLLNVGAVITVNIDEETRHYRVAETALEPTTEEESAYTVTLDACTLERLLEGADAIAEYDAGNIEIDANGFDLKLTFTKALFGLYRLFTNPPFELWIEGETATLENAGSYSAVGGPTSRGPGELYLGTGGSSARYEFESKHKGQAYLYVRVSDDALHRDGARNALFTINGAEYEYVHTSTNYVKDGNHWGWETLGPVTLVKGTNTLVITKTEQTSAAFVMDKLLLSEEKRDD